MGELREIKVRMYDPGCSICREQAGKANDGAGDHLCYAHALAIAKRSLSTAPSGDLVERVAEELHEWSGGHNLNFPKMQACRDEAARICRLLPDLQEIRLGVKAMKALAMSIHARVPGESQSEDDSREIASIADRVIALTLKYKEGGTP